VANRKYIRVVAGLTILGILILSVDGDALVAQLMSLHPKHLLYAAACIATATLLGSYNAYLIVAVDSIVSYARFLGFYWVSWALGLVVPGQIGDVASLTYLMKRAGVDWAKIMARAVLDKLISLLVMAMLAGIALIRFASIIEIQYRTLVWIAAAGLVVIAAAFFFLRKMLLASPNEKPWAARVRSSIRDVGAFVRDYPALVTINVFGTTLKILLIGTAYWFVFLAGGAENPPWLDVILLVTVSSLVAYIPVSFNGLGTVEITGILLFSLLGFSEELVLSSYLVLRVTVLAIAWAPSMLVLLLSRQHRS